MVALYTQYQTLCFLFLKLYHQAIAFIWLHTTHTTSQVKQLLISRHRNLHISFTTTYNTLFDFKNPYNE